MICPKCGFEQPDSPECMRCGIIISRYRGPFLGSAALRPPVSPRAPSSAAGDGPAGTGSPPPPPPMEPAMAAAGGGTMYGEPAPGVAVPTFGVAASPAVHGTLEVGEILGESFSIYFSNFIPFIILTAIALSPLLIFSAWASTLQADLLLAKLAPPLSNFIRLFCAPIATAATTYGVFHQMRGGSPTVADCLKVGLSILAPMLGLALYQGIVIGVASLLCLVPGIILYVRWSVAVPAAVEERPGVQGALNRSTFLTDGYRWPIFGVLAVVFIVNLGLGGVLVMVFGLSATSSGSFLFASSLLDVLSVGITATATAVMYYRLRSIKESIDVDQIASVFA